MNPRGVVIWAESIAAAYRKQLEEHGGTVTVDGHAKDNGRIVVSLTFDLPPVVAARICAALGEES